MSFILTTSRWAGGCGTGCLAAPLSSLLQLCPPCRRTHLHSCTHITGGQTHCNTLSQLNRKELNQHWLPCYVIFFFSLVEQLSLETLVATLRRSLLWQRRDVTRLLPSVSLFLFPASPQSIQSSRRPERGMTRSVPDICPHP